MKTLPLSIAAAVGKGRPYALSDCLIGAIAIRAGAPILHSNADFDALARHTELRVYGAVR